MTTFTCETVQAIGSAENSGA